MIPAKKSTRVESLILNALQQGDKTQGQLLALTSQPYLVLVEALDYLKEQNRIEAYLDSGGAVSVVLYRLRSFGTSQSKSGR